MWRVASSCTMHIKLKSNVLEISRIMFGAMDLSLHQASINLVLSIKLM